MSLYKKNKGNFDANSSLQHMFQFYEVSSHFDAN